MARSRLPACRTAAEDAETFQLPGSDGSEAYEGAGSGQVTVRENGNAEHKVTLLLAERDQIP